MSSGQLQTSVDRFRDCGVVNEYDETCRWVGRVEVVTDGEDFTAFYDCPECGAHHDDGDPREEW